MIAAVSLQLQSAAPLFILGCDYGRWIFYWSSISLATFLFTPEKTVNMVNSYIKIKDSFFRESIIFYIRQKRNLDSFPCCWNSFIYHEYSKLS